MKVLILTVTAGQGHNRTANAIGDYLKKNNTEYLVIDALEYISPVLGETFNGAYLFSTKHVPSAYGNIYSLWEKRLSSGENSASNKTLSLMWLRLKKFIKYYNPDAIICTHVVTAQMVTTMKNKPPVTIGIITDFTVHPYWEDTQLDYYVVPSEFMKIPCIKKGIPSDKVLPFGIPISDKFKTSIKKEEACSLLGIENKKTVLVMSGSMGFGNICSQVKRIDALDGDFQILCVCGNNPRAKKRIDKLGDTKHKIYTYEFVDNIEVMMDAADILVTKPGGLTVSEALAKKLPLVIINPIPGQEERNTEFLLNAGAGVYATKHFPLEVCLDMLISSEERLSNMKNMASMLAKPDAAADLCEFIAEKLNEK